MKGGSLLGDGPCGAAGIGGGPFVASTPAASPVAVVSAISPNVGDTAGAGGRVSITVNSSTGCTGATLGGVALTSFLVDNATTVSGIPGAHAAGAVDVVVTNPGNSTGGTGLFEYWTPAQVTNVGGFYDAEKGVTVVTGVSVWADQSAAAADASQATTAKQPTYATSQFGALHGLTFDGTMRLKIAARRAQPAGRSMFCVAKWTSTQAVTQNYGGNSPLVIQGDGTGATAGTFGASAGQMDVTDANAPAHHATGSGLNDGVARLVGWTLRNHAATPADTGRAYSGGAQIGTDQAVTNYANAAWGWDSIGAGYSAATNGDGFVGTIGAMVVVDDIITAGDLTKLNSWAKQRWGTP